MPTRTIPRETRIRALLEWMHAHGSRLERCRVVSVPGQGAGLVAAEDLEPEDEILFVPRELWVTVKNPHTAFGPILRHVERRADLLLGGNAHLALLLALERGQPDSFLAPYVAELPQPTVPDDLGDEELAELQSPEMAAWVREQRDEAEETHAVLAAELPERFPEAFPNGLFDLETWRWASGHALQRSFSVELDGEEIWGQIPCMGFCNHAAGASNTYYAEDEGWLFEAGEPWPAGAPILIDYGEEKSSVDFFLYYGFVPPANPNDLVRLGLSGSASGSQGECLVGADGDLPHAFLAAAAAWALGRPGRTDARSRMEPQDEGRTLAALATAVRTQLESFPTSLREDALLLADEARHGFEHAIVAYRHAFKEVLTSVAGVLEQRADEVAAGKRKPSAPAPDEPEDERYELVSVLLERPSDA